MGTRPPVVLREAIRPVVAFRAGSRGRRLGVHGAVDAHPVLVGVVRPARRPRGVLLRGDVDRVAGPGRRVGLDPRVGDGRLGRDRRRGALGERERGDGRLGVEGPGGGGQGDEGHEGKQESAHPVLSLDRLVHGPWLRASRGRPGSYPTLTRN